MDPLKGTEFAAQLAQFSSVEQLSNMNSKLDETMNINTMTSKSINNALAATFIGKGVRAATDTFSYSGSGNVNLGYMLSANADQVSVKIYDASGNLVRTINNLPTTTGDSDFEWDGKDDLGNDTPKGNYTFKVDAVDTKKNSISSSPFVLGKVSAVKFKSDGTVFVIDGIEVFISNILEIREG
jgi:flagellar basal-body rod modification protein FlgD